MKGKAVKIALRRREHAVNAVGLRKSLTVDDGKSAGKHREII
ncbi:hypothetical protein ECDEC14C_5321 [Escherichia coli DEC14C]|nr:hypothetical protein ECDEC14C_5321 [Escherichia coli DEC14C]